MFRPSTEEARVRRRRAFGAAALGAVVAAAPVLGMLRAGGVEAAPTGLYKGGADASLVAVDALNVPGTIDLVNAKLAPSAVGVASDGSLSGKQSTATATNLKAAPAGAKLPDLVVEATQSAPPDNPKPTVNQLLQLPANPVVQATITRASAQARTTPAEDCSPDRQPISSATTDVADATVLPGVLDLAIRNSQGATASSYGTIGLVGYPNTRRSVLATSGAQVTTVSLFHGQANELNINVAAPPTLKALATGVPGTAKVEYTQPLLTITGSQTQPILLGEDRAQRATIGPVTIEIAPLVKTISADGTKASGATALLHLRVDLGAALVADLQVAPLTARAEAPIGGVTCPDDKDPLRETQKDVSADGIVPDGEAVYTITVPNRGAAPIENVKVVDTVTAPSGTSIVGTSPAAKSVDGLVATWEGLGPIPSNGVLTLFVTIKGPSDLAPGAAFSNKVDVSGTYRGQPTTGTATVDGPTGRTSPSGPSCDLSASNLSTSHTKVRQGETFQHYVHALNRGGATCQAVIVTLVHDPEEEFVSCSDGCTYDSATRTITWNIGSLAGGQSKTVTAVTRVKDTAPIGTELQGTGTISSTGAKTVKLIEPITLVTGDSVLRPPAPARLGDGGGGESSRAGGQLPATGGSQHGPLALAGALVLVALGLRTRLVRP